jgi:hypothetical protein
MGNLFFFPFHSTCGQGDFGNGAERWLGASSTDVDRVMGHNIGFGHFH